MYYTNMSYVILSENKRTGDWESSDRYYITAYGSSKEKAEEYAEARYEELKAEYSKKGWDMDDEYEETYEISESEAWPYEDGDIVER